MIRFYYGSGSPFSWRVQLVLEEKGLAYEPVLLSFEKGEHKSPAHLARSPHGKVPALEDDGVSLYESSAIVEYLEERYPRTPLLPPDPAERARVRIEETAKASERLGFADHFHLDYRDGELPDDLDLRAAIVRRVRELRPEVVLCPDPTAVFFGDAYFNHRDHRVTGWATLDAVAPAAGNPHYFPDQIVDGLAVHHVRAVYLSGTLEPNCWVDISDVLERKIDALFCHASQLTETGDWFREFLRDRAEEAGRAAGVRYAEGFRRLTFGS